jgi:hypothetical protein
VVGVGLVRVRHRASTAHAASLLDLPGAPRIETFRLSPSADPSAPAHRERRAGFLPCFPGCLRVHALLSGALVLFVFVGNPRHQAGNDLVAPPLQFRGGDRDPPAPPRQLSMRWR